MPGSEEVADNAGQVVAVQALRGQVRDSPGRARDEQVLGPAGVRYADRGVVDADVRASGADAPGSRHRELEPERIQETRLVDNGSAGMRDHAIRRAALIRSHPRSEVQPRGPEIAEAVARRAGDPVHPVRGPFQGSCRDQASQVTARHGPSLSLPGCDEPVLGLGKIRHEPEAHRQRHGTIVSYSRQACVPRRPCSVTRRAYRRRRAPRPWVEPRSATGNLMSAACRMDAGLASRRDINANRHLVDSAISELPVMPDADVILHDDLGDHPAFA
jgi:hypothetical protein